MRVFAFLVGLLIAFVAPVRADERITSFISEVTVNADASLDVRETITVNAEGFDIRRGILRDFPTIYNDRRGTRVRVGFDVLDVRRDGRAEPYAIESISNGKRIRIGDKDVLLSGGQHTYQITYRTTRQIGFFPDFDELYWNVTGNGWTFAIDEARVIVRLPPGARIAQHAEYTGYQGAQGGDARVISTEGGRYEAETTRRLGSSEGFTIAVAWQKGLVSPPGTGDQWAWFLSDNAGLMGLVFTLLLSGAYYLYAWNRVGRDPPKGTIIPIFTPPPGLGPAGARYLTQFGSDDRGFAAAIVGLAVKGYLKIADDGDVFSVTRLSTGARAAQPLTGAEQAMLNAIPSGTTVLKQSNHSTVRTIKSALEGALRRDYDGTVFLRNLPWFILGAAVSFAGLPLSALLLPGEDGVIGLMAVFWITVWWSVILGVAWAAIRGFGRGLGNTVKSIGTLMFLIPFVFGGVAGPAMMFFGAGSTPLYLLVGTAVLLGIINLTFYYLLRAPTVPGRKLLDQIEGFRMYLATAEEDRLNVLHPPEKTPELFERYLPYALALDCENEWNAKFAAVLAAAAVAGAAAPAWYSGSRWDAGRTGSFTDSLGSSLSSSVASASTAPGSSSGSGGGGSSGGGGGGGGGSGW